MKKLLITAAISAGLMGAVGLAQAAETVRIATNTPYRPMEYTTPSGKLTGFDIELGNALCKQAHLKCSWTTHSWNGIIPGLLAHRYDAIMSSMTINAQRKKHVLFSNPYIKIPSAFYVRVGSPIHKIDKKTLKGKSIGVQRGTVQDNYVTAKYGNIATIKRYQNANGVAEDMATGRLDLAFFDRITGVNTLVKKHPSKYRQAGKAISKPKKYFGSGFGIAFRRGEQKLAHKFNKALAEVKKDGTYAKIHEKYFGTEKKKD